MQTIEILLLLFVTGRSLNNLCLLMFAELKHRMRKSMNAFYHWMYTREELWLHYMHFNNHFFARLISTISWKASQMESIECAGCGLFADHDMQNYHWPKSATRCTYLHRCVWSTMTLRFYWELCIFFVGLLAKDIFCTTMVNVSAVKSLAIIAAWSTETVSNLPQKNEIITSSVELEEL